MPGRCCGCRASGRRNGQRRGVDRRHRRVAHHAVPVVSIRHNWWCRFRCPDDSPAERLGNNAVGQSPSRCRRQCPTRRNHPPHWDDSWARSRIFGRAPRAGVPISAKARTLPDVHRSAAAGARSSKATCGGQPSRCFSADTESPPLYTAVNPGNIGVSFDVLSYAGVLNVTAVCTDPDIVKELDPLTEALSTAFRRLIDAS